MNLDSPTLERWIAPGPLARHWGISKKTVLRLIASGQLPAHKLNARVFRISYVDAAAFYAARCASRSGKS